MAHVERGGLAQEEQPADVVARSSSSRVVIVTDRCKGCGLCVAVCPTSVLRLGPLNVRGYPAVVLVDNARCTSCTACALVCPDAVIEVYKPPRPPVRKVDGL